MTICCFYHTHTHTRARARTRSYENKIQVLSVHLIYNQDTPTQEAVASHHEYIDRKTKNLIFPPSYVALRYLTWIQPSRPIPREVQLNPLFYKSTFYFYYNTVISSNICILTFIACLPWLLLIAYQQLYCMWLPGLLHFMVICVNWNLL